MNYGMEIKIEEDVSEMPAKLGAAFAGDAAQKVMARSGANLVKDHLRFLSRKRHRAGLPFNFYARAADATSSGVDAGAGYISIDHEGMALRRFGGTITPRKAKWLTIPVAVEAQGKRVGEFSDIQFIINRRTQKGVVLQHGKVLYAMTKSSTHKADTTVLPSDYDLMQHIKEDLNKYVEGKLR